MYRRKSDLAGGTPAPDASADALPSTTPLEALTSAAAAACPGAEVSAFLLMRICLVSDLSLPTLRAKEPTCLQQDSIKKVNGELQMRDLHFYFTILQGFGGCTGCNSQAVTPKHASPAGDT